MANSLLVFQEGLMLLEGEPFSGIGYLELNGVIVEETVYRDGLKWGISKSSFPNGNPYKHSCLFMGVRHGKHRQWHYNGQQAEEIDYELGLAIMRKRWDETGGVVEEFELDASDAVYRHLEHMRANYRDVLQRENPSLDLDHPQQMKPK